MFAAASLTEALEEIARELRARDRRSRRVQLRRVEHARAADRGRRAGGSASSPRTKRRWTRRRAVAERASVLSNTLVIVVRDKRVTHPRDLVGLKRRARGAVDRSRRDLRAHVSAEARPVGARRSRTSSRPTTCAPRSPRSNRATSTRRSSTRPTRGSRSDVRVAYEVPRAEGPRISYPFAVRAATRSSREPRARFLAYLRSKPALRRLRETRIRCPVTA